MIAVADGAVNRMHIAIARPFVGIKDRPSGWHIGGHDGAAGLFGRPVAHDVAYLARVAADDTEDRQAVVRKRAMAAPFIRSSSRWVCRVGVAVTFFPPRSDTTHPLQRQCRSGVVGRRLIHIVLHPLAQGDHRLPRQAQFAGQALGGFSFGNAAQQQHER